MTQLLHSDVNSRQAVLGWQSSLTYEMSQDGGEEGEEEEDEERGKRREQEDTYLQELRGKIGTERET